ncbi:MAG: thioredoxin family protein [Bacteroidetes bacterium]|nr:thioredoxin family protein [Bacteroidota bacterium]
MFNNYIKNSISYLAYYNLLIKLMGEKKTTGLQQDEALLNYAKLNLARMKRLHETIALTGELKEVLKNIHKKYYFIVLTEGWCGDAAQNLPLLQAIESETKNIQLCILLRDENIELIDKFLTNGGRSIPKIICTDENMNNTLFTWGPRPKLAQELVMQLVAQKASLEVKSLEVQKWYNADKTMSQQSEFVELLKQLH